MEGDRSAQRWPRRCECFEQKKQGRSDTCTYVDAIALHEKYFQSTSIIFVQHGSEVGIVQVNTRVFVFVFVFVWCVVVCGASRVRPCVRPSSFQPVEAPCRVREYGSALGFT